MPNTRDRAAQSKQRRWATHIARIEKANDPKAKLMAAWGLFLSAWTHCKDDSAKDKFGRQVLGAIVAAAQKLHEEN